MKPNFFGIFNSFSFKTYIMLKKNQSNFYFMLLKRTKKMKYTSFSFDLVLVKKRNHNYFFVVEKIGAINYKIGVANINYFRLIFWMSHNPGCSAKFAKFLYKYLIVK